MDQNVFSSNMDISISPCTNKDNKVINVEVSNDDTATLYSKVISSCQNCDKIPLFATPKNNENVQYKKCSSVKRRVLYNPFNADIKEKLKNPTFSPSVFSIVVSPSQDSSEFKWTIEDLSRINPAHIEEEFCYEDKLDEETENDIQKTIEKYFNSTHMIPSPWDCKLPTSWKSLSKVHKMESGCSTQDDKYNITVESQESPCFSSLPPSIVQNSGTQTALSLPPDLPEEVDNALKPYFSQCNFDEENLNLSCLPRKLFFHSEEELLSPVKYDTEKLPSPVLSGIIISSSMNTYFPSTPVIESRTIGTPLPHLSPDLSPIDYNENKRSVSAVSMMQVDSPNQDYGIVSLEAKEIEKSKNNEIVFKECSKVFDSPKITKVNRTKKRRLNCIQNLPEISSCTMDVDITSFSQDTGYQTDCTRSGVNNQAWHTNTANKSVSNRSDSKMSFCELWSDEDKENILAASTPNKRIRI